MSPNAIISNNGSKIKFISAGNSSLFVNGDIGVILGDISEEFFPIQGMSPELLGRPDRVRWVIKNIDPMDFWKRPEYSRFFKKFRELKRKRK